MSFKKQLKSIFEITNAYEVHDDLLAHKLSEIENAIPSRKNLNQTYDLSQKLFAMLRSEPSSRQMTEGFEKLRAQLLAKQNEIMENL